MLKVRKGGSEEIPLVQDKEQGLLSGRRAQASHGGCFSLWSTGCRALGLQ